MRPALPGLRRLFSSQAAQPRVVFSGIQPTGIPHLGNYAGALRQWVQLQQQAPDAKLIYSIVDLHAITMPQDADQLRRWRRETLAALLAVGINPDRCTVFYQSAVSSGALGAHVDFELHCFCRLLVTYDPVEGKSITTIPRRMLRHDILMNMAQQKLNLAPDTAVKNNQSRLKLGLFSYPVLQAADVLVHRYDNTIPHPAATLLVLGLVPLTLEQPRATHVPVGDDQRQHLEFARECVTNFNNAYGPLLVEPQTITPPVHRIMSLTDPKVKMSKSHKSDRSRILITDKPQDIETKIGRALTDSTPGISYDVETRPGYANLLDIMSTFDSQGRSPTQLASEYNQYSPKQFKEAVSYTVAKGLDGVRDRFFELVQGDGKYLDNVAEEGAHRARKSAEETMCLVREAVGF
ncbi:hypothetical protein S7711_04533 [Stachybotrys chartarum IBT 7711]|uniref:tryptophan--tRNA ligase n=1 Tax=Stachybotrys chartarum (strain CBS 109288 / IBT 7711) TaxID=1280523 RepID=A0A084APQ1_STACB|nr:hypothetical protein S7711_04533 [Stachybotrys chartarum IBT 7711]KFA52886.1 hypothetical protein S40293_00968 [Stachybotrys chartarum IBT 40293]